MPTGGDGTAYMGEKKEPQLPKKNNVKSMNQVKVTPGKTYNPNERGIINRMIAGSETDFEDKMGDKLVNQAKKSKNSASYRAKMMAKKGTLPRKGLAKLAARAGQAISKTPKGALVAAGLIGAVAGARAIGKKFSQIRKNMKDAAITKQVDKYVADRKIPGGPKKVNYKPTNQYTVTRDSKGKVTGTGKLIRVVPGTEFKEETMTPAQKRKDTMLKKKYEKSDDMMKSFKDQYGEKEGEKIFYAKIRKDAMKEELDKKDKPFVRHLVKKLRSGSKTHAKQADNLEKAMNEGLGATGAKTAPSPEEMKKKQFAKEPLTQQSLDARKTAQANVVGKMNQLEVGSGTNKDALKSALSKSGMGIKMDADGVVPNVGAVVQKKAEYGMNIARNTMSNNPAKFTSAQKNDFKTADNYLKSGQIEKNVQRQIPGSQQFRLDIGADEVNLATQKFKPKTNKGFKFGMQKEDIADEALTIQDWNVDDIKFTEIETVDIIKAKPLKESMSNWRDELDEDWQKVNRKDKTDGLSQKAVNAYRRENPGSKLKTAVTKDPKKLKKGSKSAKRRLSFCRRMKGMKKKLTSAKTSRDPDSRINKALRRWNC